MGASPPPAEAANPITDKVIFVVDDDEQIGLLLTQLIHQETPHHAWHHSTGSQTLEAITTHTPHLLILDYDLPDMNGLELHDRLHTLERLRNVPTLLISAIKPPMQEVRKRAITFLAKPLDLIELLRIIRRLLR
jgi:DNA-binding NtrC family response regulator